MKNMVIVGAATPHLHIADVIYNTKQIVSAIRSFSGQLLVFPELSITGYTCGDLFQQEELINTAWENLFAIASETKGKNIAVVVGLPVCYKNKLYNCAAFLADGHVCGIVPKINIPNYGEFYEARWFSSGCNIQGAHLKGASKDEQIPFGTDLLFATHDAAMIIGTDICEDLWVPDKPSTHSCMAGANIIVNPSASDETIGKSAYRQQMIAQQSAACYCGYIYTSAGQDESSTDMSFSGHRIIASSGKTLASSIYDENHVILDSVIDLDMLKHDRLHQTTYCIEEPMKYQTVHFGFDVTDVDTETIKSHGFSVKKTPFVPSIDDMALRASEITAIQVHGLVTRMRSTGIKTLVIGVSGGLDSTLALLVAHKSCKLVPDSKIIGITMPGQGTTTRTKSNAIKLMKHLGVDFREIPIGDSVTNHLIAIRGTANYGGDKDVTYENAQARERTQILMDMANNENGMVIGTGDLSELALGWCTYNGDHMSMYAVNTSIPKTLVKYLVLSYAKEYGYQELYDICDTPISPELVPTVGNEMVQKTEDKIGKYDWNDFFLYYMLRYGFTPLKILEYAMIAYPDISKQEIVTAEERFYKRFFSQQFKRNCLPDGPKVGSVTLSPRGDWRMPSDASSAFFVSKLDIS